MTPLKSAFAVVAVLTVVMTTASAQQSPMPEEFARKLLELGSAIDGPDTAKLYAPLHEKEPYQGVKVERDVKYGAADRNLLDVFMPASASPPRPVLIFVHGGAFVAGDRRESGTPFYDNIMLWAVRNGFVGVNIGYRLRRAMGRQQHRRARRRSRADLSDGTFRRRRSRRKLRVTPGILQSERQRPCRCDHDIGFLRSDGDAARRSRACLFRRGFLAVRRRIVAAGLGDNKHTADDRCRRNGSSHIPESIRAVERRHLQNSKRMRPRAHIAAAQPYVGSVFDQYRGHAADRPDP